MWKGVVLSAGLGSMAGEAWRYNGVRYDGRALGWRQWGNTVREPAGGQSHYTRGPHQGNAVKSREIHLKMTVDG